MKILVTSIVDLTASQHNRPHQFVRHLAQNHDVTVLSINDWWKRDQRRSSTHGNESHDFLNLVEYRYITEKRVSPIVQEVLFRKVRNELSREGFDVQLNYNSLVTGYEISKHIGTVFDIADDLAAMINASPQIPSPLRPLGRTLGSYYLKKQIAQARHITLTCGGLQRLYHIPDAKSDVLPNGVDLEFFRKAGKVKAEIGLDGFVIGYVGVLREWVGLEPVFRALKKLDTKIKMLVVGNEGNFRETVDLAEACGVADKVVFTGQIDYRDVPRYIAAMDVCVIPFKLGPIAQCALPLKLFEYMACGKPVLSSPLDAVNKVAGELVQYCSSVADYVEAITALHEDETLRERLGARGEKLIETGYGWDGICQKMEDILTRVAAECQGTQTS
jgi:glycosyltransferase involved in cell wall biosynthesis